jgi:hypothetical protein
MRTYDLAWQHTRMLEDMMKRDRFDSLESEALLTLARVHRLAAGVAGPLSDRTTASRVDQLREQASTMAPNDIKTNLENTTSALIRAFDAGDFLEAERHALRVLIFAGAYSAVVAPSEP